MDLVSAGVAKNHKPDTWWRSVCLSIALLGVFGLSLFVASPTTVEAVNLGTWATSSPVGNNDNWRAVTYGAGRFVAVGISATDNVMTSTDGVTWATTSAAANNDTWLDVTYGNGRFVAVGSSTNPSRDVVMYSTDGLTWSTTTAAGDNDRWHSVTYGNGVFVAVGSLGDRVMTSTDGVTWATTTAAGNNDDWQSVTYGNGVFVAVGSGGDRVMYSTTSTSWFTRFVAGNDDSWSSIAFGNNRFVAVGSTSDRVMYSDDGVIWTPVASTTAATNNDSWFDVTYGNGIFMAVGSSTNPSRDVIIYSPDGVTWATSTAAGDNDQWRSIAYGNGRFVGVGTAVGDRAMYALSAPWSLTQPGFQFRNDDGNEVTATAIGGQNSNVTWGLNTPIRLRTQIESVLATTASPYYLQYKKLVEPVWKTVGVDSPFPTIVGTSSGRTTISTTGHSITLPTNTVIGDLLLVVFSHDGASTSRTTSAGWQKMGESSNTNVVTGAVYFKRTTGGDTLSISTSGSEASSYIAYAIRNAGTPSGQVADGSSTNSNPPAHGVGVVSPHLVFVTRSGDSTTLATVAPTGYGDLFSQSAFDTGGASTNGAYTYFTGSTTDPGTFTSANEQWVSWTIFVPPGDTPTTGNLILADGQNPATSTNDTAIGSIAWTNPENATSSTNSWATLTTSSTTASNYLEVAQFGFAIPAQATIVGIEAFIEKWGSGGATGTVRDNSIRLVKAGAATGTNYAATAVAWDTIERMSKYGSTSDRWGTTWTSAEINATDFGIAIAVQGNAAGANRIARVDHVTLNVYYTMGSDFVLAASSNITAGGASTTARLISPGSFSTSSFKGGHITDDQAATPIIVASTTAYTEIEWSIMATGTASTSEQYQFRVANGLEGVIPTRNNEIFFTVGSSSIPNVVTVSGTVFTEYGTSTTVGAGVPVVLARTENGSQVLYSTTTIAGGQYSLSIATGTESTGTWQTVKAAGNNDGWSDVIYGNGRYVAVGGNDGSADDRAMTSTDGLSWTVVTAQLAAGNNDNWNSVAYGNGRFVAVGTGPSTDRVMTSTDGLTWATTSAAGDNDSWYAVAYGNGRFVAVGDSSGAGDGVMYSDDGITWATTTAAGDDDIWYDVAYGNGRFVAVGNGPGYGDGPGDTVMYSDDGITWSAVSVAGNNDVWPAVVYGNGRFVAVGQYDVDGFTTDGDTIAYSSDGINWATTSVNSNDTWYEVIYANGKFMTLGATVNPIYSTDGVNWQEVSTPIPSPSQFTDLAYGAGRFVAVGRFTGDRVMVLDEGLGFENAHILYTNSTTTPATTIFTSTSGTSTIAGVDLFGNTTLSFTVAGSATTTVNDFTDLPFFDSTNDSNVLYTVRSSDSTTINSNFVTATGTTRAPSNLSLKGDWQQLGTFDSNGGIVALAGANSRVSGTVTGSSSLVNVVVDAQSDGREWVAVASSSAVGNDDDWNAVTYGNGRFLAVGNPVGDNFITSTDGLTWIITPVAGNNDSWQDVTYGNGRFVAVGIGGDRIAYSDDGLSWSTTTTPGNDEFLTSVTYGNGRFVAVGVDGGRVIHSQDSINWTAVATSSAAGNDDEWRSLTYGNGRFVAVGNSTGAGDAVMYSEDGFVWSTTSAAGDNDDWYSVTYGNGRFVAVGYGPDLVMTSKDGLVWSTTSPANTDSVWDDVTYGNGRFVATGDSAGGFVMSSIDGLVWTDDFEAAGNDDYWTDILRQWSICGSRSGW
jgi:hypothetical protein